ncbi:TniQ family protein [Streptomyces sp. NPDC060000]|uniref:TniQ family protein n=1 Tax=Streptomyces sp. NPDC060000 TaxID=3347031 RepID=UPI0036ADEDFF
MTQTELTDGLAAVTGAAPYGASVAGARVTQSLSVAPGVLRVRPLPGEAAASYLEHLAHAYRLTVPQLLDGIGITVHGHGVYPTAELSLSPTAACLAADAARIRLDSLTRALPGLPPNCTASAGPATARWKPLERQQQAVAACTMCVRHRRPSAPDTAWIHRPWHRLVCPRHQQAAPDPRLTTPLRTEIAPELTAACYAHQRLKRHPRAASAWMTARAITTRWYDHQQHLADRWQSRLNLLTAANPHLSPTSSASPALLARDLVIYPETVALARTLATLPRKRPPNPAHDALTAIARRLGLDTLTPTAHDPLGAYLTHTRP